MEAIAFDITTWALISSTILPLLVGVVTKTVASSRVKSILLAVFSGINGAVSSIIQNDAILSDSTLSAAAISFVVAVSVYYGVLKPTGASAAVQAKTTNIGIG